MYKLEIPKREQKQLLCQNSFFCNRGVLHCQSATQKKLFYFPGLIYLLSWLFKGPKVVVNRAKLLLSVVSDSTFQKLRKAQISCKHGKLFYKIRQRKFRFSEEVTKIWLNLPRVCSPSLNHYLIWHLASYDYIIQVINIKVTLS